jgi:peptidyl-prolyl cis-trans isomerase SurA
MIKKCILLLLVSAAAFTGLYSQDSPVLLTIGNENVTLEEFERIYQKNNSETSMNRQTPEEYLDLFINFKLKVMEAEALGMDTTRKFIDELEGYRKQLARPYMTDNETREEMMKEAYERAQYDINASHILIKLPPNPDPEDTLAAYERIIEIRDRIVNGEPFDVVARATSDDASAQRNGGNLNYFTVFSMVYPFENVAYNTPVGEVSMPFRSDYGYHILKVNDRRPARGQIKVAHIFIRTTDNMSDEQKVEAYEKAQMVYDSLQLGADFGRMARLYSEEPNSAQNGGEIPYFGTGRMIPEFEDACFSIENEGDICEPVKSIIGWHIIKLIDKKGIGTYEEMKPELQEKINRGGRTEVRTEKYINRLKAEYGFSENLESLDPVYAAVDSTLFSGIWKAGALAGQNEMLMTIGPRQVTTGEFAAYLESQTTNVPPRSLVGYVDELYKKFSQEKIMEYEESKLPEKFPEYRYVYEEYHDGILLFDIMDQKVWSKAVTDTSGLEAFHQSHREDYMWPERLEAYQVSCGENADVQGIRKAYKKILKGRWDEDDLNDRFCDSDTLKCVTLTRLLVVEGENERVDRLNGIEGPGPVFEEDTGSGFIILKGIRPPEPKALDEARGQITSDYQNYLESEWIKQLKEKYPVEVNRELLSRINPS